MNTFYWYQIVIMLGSSAAMGAIITHILSNYRNRHQPIGTNIIIIPVHKNTFGSSTFSIDTKDIENNSDHEFNNQFLARIKLINKGNKDYADFKFGIVLTNNNVATSVETHSPGHLHIVEQITPVTEDSPAKIINFVISFFNRADEYNFDILVGVSPKKIVPSDIKLDSPHPINFVKIQPARNKNRDLYNKTYYNKEMLEQLDKDIKKILKQKK